MKFFLTALAFLLLLDARDAIPEPMVFDMIRPLSAKKGELEINTLVHAPFDAFNERTSQDPFGTGTSTYDHQSVEWAPEIEYALSDGFAVEFELPFEGTHLEAYKFGAQYTLGRPSDAYIHGLQFLYIPSATTTRTSAALLYLGGYRFNRSYSTLFMVGIKDDVLGSVKFQRTAVLANATFFKSFQSGVIIGFETNFSQQFTGSYAATMIPQVHYELTHAVELQAGYSLGVGTFAYEQALIFRGIYTF